MQRVRSTLTRALGGSGPATRIHVRAWRWNRCSTGGVQAAVRLRQRRLVRHIRLARVGNVLVIS